MTDAMLTAQPRFHANQNPNKLALQLMTPGEAVVPTASISYAEFEDTSARLANWFRQVGLSPGDHVSILSFNHQSILAVAWAAQRSGLYYTPINPQLKPDEAAYIVNNSDARILLVGHDVAELAHALIPLTSQVEHRLAFAEPLPDHVGLDDAIDGMGSEPSAREVEGTLMGYTSGTTGQPKGVFRPLSGNSVGLMDPLSYTADLAGVNSESIFITTAALYHAAPMAWSISVLRRGGTVVLMKRFDALAALEIIDQLQITHGLWVPTMLVRMLKLDDEVRDRFDLSSLKSAVHVGAPCAPEIKQRMIDWWGPVIDEFYAGTEANGSTFITSDEWLGHRGSVGQAVRGVLHITDDEGVELPTGEPGVVWFDPASTFEYYKDPAKTAAAHNELGWSKLGDIGYLDEEGYLYLTDRAHFMIISGGVNIYPQEIENLLISHDEVADVAAFGVPNADLGEEVKVVIEPAIGVKPDDLLATKIMEYCSDHLAGYKCPRSVDFVTELPRADSGKLMKADLRQSYWD